MNVWKKMKSYEDSKDHYAGEFSFWCLPVENIIPLWMRSQFVSMQMPRSCFGRMTKHWTYFLFVPNFSADKKSVYQIERFSRKQATTMWLKVADSKHFDGRWHQFSSPHAILLHISIHWAGFMMFVHVKSWVVMCIDVIQLTGILSRKALT